MPKYAELKASLASLWDVMSYLRAELLEVKYYASNPESKWFEGQRMVLEDTIAHVDRMITDVENQIEAL